MGKIHIRTHAAAAAAALAMMMTLSPIQSPRFIMCYPSLRLVMQPQAQHDG